MSASYPKYCVKQLPHDERPREKLKNRGAKELTTAELIAVLLGSGTKERPILQLAQDIVASFGSLDRLADASVEEICEVKGIGCAKAIQLKAALALADRLSKNHQKRPQVIFTQQAIALVEEDLINAKEERLIALLLDAKSCLIGKEIIAIGTLTQALIHPREVFYPAIRQKAAALLLAHNHPSGDPSPSLQDQKITKSLVQAGKLLGIPLHDHIILGCGRFVSLLDAHPSLFK